jgi:hypothetical protein
MNKLKSAARVFVVALSAFAPACAFDTDEAETSELATAQAELAAQSVTIGALAHSGATVVELAPPETAPLASPPLVASPTELPDVKVGGYAAGSGGSTQICPIAYDRAAAQCGPHGALIHAQCHCSVDGNTGVRICAAVGDCVQVSVQES